MTEKKPEGKETKKAEKSEEKPLEKMTVVELREIAKAIEGVTGVHAMKKDELLAIVKKDRGIKDEKPKPAAKKGKKKKTVSRKEMTKKDLLVMMAELRAEKATAKEANDKKKTIVLRRQIKRLKRQTRKKAAA